MLLVCSLKLLFNIDNEISAVAITMLLKGSKHS